VKVLHRPSPNFNDRPADEKPSLIVIHYTGMASTGAALERLSNPASGVSCHYLIDERGRIYRMVEEGKRAWHAGVSHWRGRGDVNSRSIGIELSNRGYEEFTQAQQEALVRLCKDIMRRHGIPPENVVGHSDIAPDRKQDPGPRFPWKKMAALGIGRWPKATCRDAFNAAAACKKEKYLRKLFAQAGYGVDAFGPGKPSFRELVTAFQSRYEPAVFDDPRRIGTPTAATVVKLRAVARMEKRRLS
jgi:N-acetylmuramoyl-L-alanine amidase